MDFAGLSFGKRTSAGAALQKYVTKHFKTGHAGSAPFVPSALKYVKKSKRLCNFAPQPSFFLQLGFKICILFNSFHSWADEAYQGPLLTRSHAIGQLFRLNPPMQDAEILSPAEMRFDVSRTYSNLWARDKRFVIDGEVSDDQAHFKVGVGFNFQLYLGFSSRRFANTATDQTAITVHDILQIGQDGRLETGKHRTRFSIPDNNLEYSRKNKDKPFSEQLEAGFGYALFTSTDQSWNFAIHNLLSYEMANGAALARGAKDFATIVSGSKQHQQWLWYANGRHISFEDSGDALPGARTINRGISIGTIYQLSDDQSLLSQFMNNQPIFRDLGQLSRNSYEWQFGYRFHWNHSSLELTLIENVFWLYNSPDWGVTLGLISRIP